jgi:hypothetical protein
MYGISVEMSEETNRKSNSTWDDNIKMLLKKQEIQKMKSNPNSSERNLLLSLYRHSQKFTASTKLDAKVLMTLMS